MKTAYVLNIPLTHGEVSVVMSDHAEKTLQHSAKLASSIHKSGLGVLLINCGVSDKRFRETAPKPDVKVIATRDQDGEGFDFHIKGMPSGYLKFPDDEDPETVKKRPHI